MREETATRETEKCLSEYVWLVIVRHQGTTPFKMRFKLVLNDHSNRFRSLHGPLLSNCPQIWRASFLKSFFSTRTANDTCIFTRHIMTPLSIIGGTTHFIPQPSHTLPRRGCYQSMRSKKAMLVFARTNFFSLILFCGSFVA